MKLHELIKELSIVNKEWGDDVDIVLDILGLRSPMKGVDLEYDNEGQRVVFHDFSERSDDATSGTTMETA